MAARIRPAERADADRSIYGPLVASTPISFEVDPPSVGVVADRIEATLREHP